MADADDKPKKNAHAVELARLGASKGGKVRAEKLTAEQKKEIASKAAKARWRANPVRATHAGIMKIGDMELPCANLPDGRRVISELAVMRALGRGYSGYYSQRDAAAEPGSAILPRYVSPAALRPYIPQGLTESLSTPTPYLPPEGGTVAKGVNADAIPQICEVWLKARDAGVLSPVQARTAAKAEILMRGLAHVGIVALVDAATGFERIRDRLALEKILNAFMLREFAAWAKRFPDEFYKELFRLRGWNWNGMRVKRPQVVAYYTKDIVYARLAPGILTELEKRNPMTPRGRLAKHHQFLTEDVGHPALAQHLHAVIAFMRASRTWDGFMRLLDTAFPRRGDTINMPFMAEPPPGESDA